MKNPDLKRAIEESGRHKELTEFVLSTSRMLKLSEKLISKQFIKAVNNHDGQKIIEIAEAVWFFNGKYSNFFEHGGNYKDRERAFLLLAKFQLNHAGEKWTRKQTAIYVTGDKNPTKEKIDSISDKGRAMNFPFAIEQKIRKK
jgi:hypothetical protein